MHTKKKTSVAAGTILLGAVCTCTMDACQVIQFLEEKKVYIQQQTDRVFFNKILIQFHFYFFCSLQNTV